MLAPPRGLRRNDPHGSTLFQQAPFACCQTRFPPVEIVLRCAPPATRVDYEDRSSDYRDQRFLIALFNATQELQPRLAPRLSITFSASVFDAVTCVFRTI